MAVAISATLISVDVLFEILSFMYPTSSSNFSHENPYDGATLRPAIKQVERITAIRPTAAFVDRGFKGTTYHPADVLVYVSGRKRLRRTWKAMLRRRSAIEPVIGHLKHEHKMERNHLLGKEGDRINALLTGCGFNLRKLWRYFKSSVSLQPA